MESAGEGVDVDVVRIDEVVSCGKPIALLKVDIEGADAWALIGSEQLWKTNTVKEIWFEQNKPRIQELGIPLNAAQDFLSSMEYSFSPNGSSSGDLVEWTAIPNEEVDEVSGGSLRSCFFLPDRWLLPERGFLWTQRKKTLLCSWY